MTHIIKYPKVLVVSGEPFHEKSATGITISNLFRGWPKEKLAQVYTAQIEPDFNICDKNWRISNKNLWIYSQLNGANREVCTPVAPMAVGVGARQVSINTKIPFVRKWLVPLIDLVPYQLPDAMLEQIKIYDPDVIYSLLGNIRIVRLVDMLSRELNIPVVPHFMDDWLSTYSVDGRSIISILPKYIINAKTRSLMSRASVGFSIGKSMANEYEARFGKKFYAFMNPVDLNSRKLPTKLSNRELVLTYVGGLHLGRHKNLLDVASAIAGLRADGVRLIFNIYAPASDIQAYGFMFKDMDGTNVVGTIRPEEVKDVLAVSDVAVHVESFQRQHSVYTRLSVSTKIPQYFAAGLPVIAYGPFDLASCKYVTDNKCGVCVGKEEVMCLMEAVHNLVSNEAIRNELGENAIKTAQLFHDELKERDRFRDLLYKASL